MRPTLRPGDLLLVRLTPDLAKVDDLVVVRWPSTPLAVKRLMSIESDGSWWVVRDSATTGVDSFSHGPVPVDGRWGVVLARLWPPRPRRTRMAG